MKSLPRLVSRHRMYGEIVRRWRNYRVAVAQIIRSGLKGRRQEIIELQRYGSLKTVPLLTLRRGRLQSFRATFLQPTCGSKNFNYLS